MKLWRLFFYSINIVCAINFTPLFAENINKNMDAATSVDEIVMMLSQQGFCRDDIEKALRNFNHILNKQFGRREKIANIIVNNKQSEEFYARKNFKEKLKIIVAAVITIIICNTLFKFRWKIAGFFERFWGLPITVSDQGKAVDADKQSQPKEPEVQTTASVESTDTQIDHTTKSLRSEYQVRRARTGHGKSVRHIQPTSISNRPYVHRKMINQYSIKKLMEGMKMTQTLIEEMERLDEMERKKIAREAQQATEAAHDHTND